MTEPPVLLCAMCDAPGKNVCSICQTIRYCGKICQTDDWNQVHKHVCKALTRDYPISERPSPSHKRAIYFPENHNKPLFTWLGFKKDGKLDEKDLPGDNEGVQDLAVFGKNDLLGRTLERPIFWAGKFKRDEEESEATSFVGASNRSLLVIDEELSIWWKGPFLAYSPTSDLDTSSLRHLVDILRRDFDCQTNDLYKKNTEGYATVTGVRANCIGDVQIVHRDDFESVDVPKEWISEPSAIQTPIMDLIGIPLIVRQVPHALQWKNRHIKPTTTPPTVGVFLGQADEYMPAESNGIIDILASSSITEQGTVIVIRKDGKPVSPAQLEIMESFCKEKAALAMTELWDRITKVDFEEHWKEAMEKNAGDEDFEGVVSPFDVYDRTPCAQSRLTSIDSGVLQIGSVGPV
ncbi:hypothetical protein K504DRAFT_530337 [Pleomassaria siparia CBS 279.74]|uniref:MYND-type domain-containing protein n=1 Tax=Pleomassaria siparia CBS 279.74 TaxID=1314801 RepID=A0A6G1KLH6_9PLEO|nr:hypothetical protein K504DRAFT_530337 [Pleomassaria siparia CBS 279.74]